MRRSRKLFPSTKIQEILIFWSRSPTTQRQSRWRCWNLAWQHKNTFHTIFQSFLCNLKELGMKKVLSQLVVITKDQWVKCFYTFPIFYSCRQNIYWPSQRARELHQICQNFEFFLLCMSDKNIIFTFPKRNTRNDVKVCLPRPRVPPDLFGQQTGKRRAAWLGPIQVTIIHLNFAKYKVLFVSEYILYENFFELMCLLWSLTPPTSMWRTSSVG